MLIVKLFFLLCITIGVVSIYQYSLSRHVLTHTISEDKTISTAMRSVRFGRYFTYVVLINILLASIILLINV